MIVIKVLSQSTQVGDRIWLDSLKVQCTFYFCLVASATTLLLGVHLRIYTPRSTTTQEARTSSKPPSPSPVDPRTMGEDKRFVVQAAIFSQKTSSNSSVSSAGNRSTQSEYRGQRRRTLRQRLLQSQTVDISKQICLLVTRRQVVHKLIGASLVLYLIFHMNNGSFGDEAGDITIPTKTVKKQQYKLRISSFLDMSWATWGKDTTQFETLLPPSEMDFSIDRRLPWSSQGEDTDYCDDVLLFMPYLLAIGGNGQGSQLNSYLLASLVATYLNKALVILEPPRDFNRFSQGSQFGCPTDPYKEYGTTTRFPDGLQRMIQHPHFISRGCRVPCQGTMTYKDWEIKRQSLLQYLKKGELHHEECKEASRHIKVMPMGGYDLRELFHRSLRSQMVDRSSSNYDPKQAHSWAMRLGAKPHEAEVFTTLSNASEIWDFLSALMSRSGLLRFQPWIARDVAEYIRSSNLPTDVSYDAIHVRRGDKLIREATKEVNNYWLERGYRQPFPTNYIPFAHYIERGWGGRHGNYCKRIKLRGTVNNKLSARLVYIATDDPATVRKEIDELPKAKGGNTIADNCYRLRFIFSPAAQEDGTVYHLNSKGFHDDCRDRYLRNVQVSKNSSISSHTLDSSWD